jgi:hypothetical protein
MTINQEDRIANVRRQERVMAASGLLGAIAASSCCITSTAHGGFLRLSADDADHRHHWLLRARRERARDRRCTTDNPEKLSPSHDCPWPLEKASYRLKRVL